MNKLEKNRVFDRDKLKELEQNCTRLMNQAVNSSQNAEKELNRIKGIIDRIPAEAKEYRLQSDIGRISGKLNKFEFTACRTRVKRSLSKLMLQVPNEDKALATKIDSVAEDARRVEKAAQDLRRLISGGVTPGNYRDFTGKIEELKSSWQIGEVIKKDLMAAMIQRMKQLNGKDPVNEYSADPVNLSTGNFIYGKEELKIPGLMPLSFKRFYNSLDDQEGSLGSGWIHNYEIRLKIEESFCTLILEEGSQERFAKESDRLYRSVRSGLETIEIMENESETVYIYEDRKGLFYIFHEDGHLLKQQDPNGNSIRLTYNEEGKLEKAEPSGGGGLYYTYHANGKLSSVADHTGRTVNLEYREDRLRKVTDPAGGILIYSYNKGGKISGVINPSGNSVLNNTFDQYHRVTKQRFPDGGEMHYEYRDDENQIVLTERNGSKLIYVHDDRFRSVKNIYEDGEETFVYNDRDEKVLYRDKRGYNTQYSYDEKGNLTQVVNPLGDITNLEYGDHNKVIRVSLNGKVKVKKEYDRNGNAVKVTDPGGKVLQFQYNEQGLPIKVVYEDGSRMLFAYDSRGNLTEILDQRSSKTEYQYDHLNRVIKTVDGNGNAVSFKYDSMNRLTEVCNAEGRKQYYTYNHSGKVTSVTGFDGSKVTVEYNEINKPARVVDALGNETVYEYDRMWNVSKRIDPNGAETRYRYDALNRLESVVNPLGGKISYGHDPNGNCIKIIDEDEEVTCFTYDALNRRTQMTQANGAKTEYIYGTGGRLAKVIDALGNETRFEYNDAGQKVKEINALGQAYQYHYDNMGRISGIKDPAGRETRYEYEKGGLLSSVWNADGTWETYTYDNNGNVIQIESPKGGTIQYVYDSMDRIRCVRGSQGQEKYYTYDAVGNVTSMTDSEGNTTSCGYDAAGHLVRVTDALGGETDYHYDVSGNLAEIRQHGDFGDERKKDTRRAKQLTGIYEFNRRNREIHHTIYHRNLAGQVERIVDAQGETGYYRYDKKGRLIQKADKDGYVTSYGYTPTGEVNLIQYEEGKEVRFSYNPLRQLEEMEDWLGITRIERDPLSRPVKISDSRGRTVTYTWGKAGERQDITYPDGKRVAYDYDKFLRLKEVREGDIHVNYAYDEGSRLRSKSFSNGIRSQYEYNSLGQLERLEHWIGEELYDCYRYGYNSVGNKVKIEKDRKGLEQENGIYEYQYDPLQRLQEVIKDGRLLRSYTYDSFGNRTGLMEGDLRINYKYNQVNQLITKTGNDGEEEHYIYDGRGNRTEVWKNDVCINQYSYGVLNRMERAVNYQTGTAMMYQYNGLGNRVGKTEGILPDCLQPADDLNQINIQPVKQIDDILDITKEYNNLLERKEGEKTTSFIWDGNILSASDDSGGICYLHDELGSPIRLLRENRREHDLYEYDEFGQDLTGNQGDLQPFGYTGYQYDRTAGTYFAQAREYLPKQGRFTGEDILKGSLYHPDSLNAYGYCRNQPMNQLDPNGMEVLVISGGHAGHESHYMFIETGINSIKEMQAQMPDEEITWMVADSGYSDLDKWRFQNTADSYGAAIKFVSTSDEIVEYINYKDDNQQAREGDQISHMEVFSHGGIGTLLLGYHGNTDVNFSSEDIGKLESYAFDNAATWFGSCNTGTGIDGGASFAQLWSNKTGGKSTAAVDGQTTYTHINVVENLGFWGGMGKKLWGIQRKLIHYSADGSYNYPTAADGIEFEEFFPERSDMECIG